MGVFQTPIWACDHRFVPPLFLVAVPGDLIPASPRYEVGKGAAFDAAAHVRLRGISGNSCALRTRVFGHQACTYRPSLALQVVRTQDLLLGGFEIAPHATVKWAVRLHGLACMPAGQNRAKSEVGLNNLVTSAEVRDFPRW